MLLDLIPMLILMDYHREHAILSLLIVEEEQDLSQERKGLLMTTGSRVRTQDLTNTKSLRILEYMEMLNIIKIFQPLIDLS
jgi:hypothetical protein